MATQRFELLAVEQHGYRVAVIYDSKVNRKFRVYFKAGKYRHWDAARDDEPVTARGLRDFAKGALAS